MKIQYHSPQAQSSSGKFLSTRSGQEKGSILVLGLGLAIVSLMVATLGVNIGTLWSTKMTLNQIADGVALSASQAIDVDYVYRTGNVNSVPLNYGFARVRAIRYLGLPEVKNSLSNLKLTRLKVRGATVSVTLSCSANLPFGYLMPQHVAIVKASASATKLSR